MRHMQIGSMRRHGMVSGGGGRGGGGGRAQQRTRTSSRRSSQLWFLMIPKSNVRDITVVTWECAIFIFVRQNDPPMNFSILTLYLGATFWGDGGGVGGHSLC